MRLSKMPKGNAGFTLVELLVVILIIVILSVTMLPLLKPFVVKAQYAAEAVPIVANLRVKTEVYRVDKNHLPGLPLSDDIKQETLPAGNNVLKTSDLGAANGNLKIHTMYDLTAAAGGGGAAVDTKYDNCVCDSDPNTAPVAPGANPEDHVFTHVDVSFTDLTGKRLRPNHVQYVVCGAVGEQHLWGIGVFGDGTGLPAGTGYAVLEFNDPDHQRKFIATFERYKEGTKDQLRFSGMNTGGAAFVDADTSKKICWIPEFAELTGADAGDYQTALQNLRLSGWEVN